MWRKSFLKINHPNQQTRKKLEKRGIEREQCLWMRWLEFFFLKDKTWCLWSNHANQQATDEGSQKVKKKSWKVTLLVNVMIKLFWNTKHDALDHQLAIANGPTPQRTDKGDWAIRENTNQALQRCAALVRRILLRLKGQRATNFGAQLLWHPRQ